MWAFSFSSLKKKNELIQTWGLTSGVAVSSLLKSSASGTAPCRGWETLPTASSSKWSFQKWHLAQVICWSLRMHIIIIYQKLKQVQLSFHPFTMAAEGREKYSSYLFAHGNTSLEQRAHSAIQKGTKGKIVLRKFPPGIFFFSQSWGFSPPPNFCST